jgi:hypothetical protein
MSSRVTTSHITNLVESVNKRLEEMGDPMHFDVQIWDSPTQVKFMVEGGKHYFSQQMTLREGYEAIALVAYTLENMGNGSK